MVVISSVGFNAMSRGKKCKVGHPEKGDAAVTENEEQLTAIIGEQLSSVEFVQDYVQFHFDGPHVIAFVWPVVEIEGKTFRLGEAEYRNVLCERIAQKVTSAFARHGDAIIIEFADGASVRISLKPSDRQGLEAALYRAGSKSSDPVQVFE
jgi:hypothetical protein